MAKVKYLGDPSGEEHRRFVEHAGVKLPRGEWAELPDHVAKKLTSNPHFEVKGISASQVAKQPARDAAYVADLEQANAALTSELIELRTQFDERGALLQEATARIAELEAALTAWQKPDGDSAPDQPQAKK